MWWIIGVVVVAIAFIAWFIWEVCHDPMMDDIFDGLILDDEEENESKDTWSNR